MRRGVRCPTTDGSCDAVAAAVVAVAADVARVVEAVL